MIHINNKIVQIFTETNVDCVLCYGNGIHCLLYMMSSWEEFCCLVL